MMRASKALLFVKRKNPVLARVPSTRIPATKRGLFMQAAGESRGPRYEKLRPGLGTDGTHRACRVGKDPLYFFR